MFNSKSVLRAKQLKRFVSASLLASVLAVSLDMSYATAAVAAKRTTLMGLEAKTQENQVVLYLSEPARANFSTPIDAMGNKTILIDLKGVQVPRVEDKESLLEAIKNALPDVSQITMSEFNGPEPMVRLMVKTSAPDIQANLLANEGNELVLQLTNPRGNTRQTITKVVESSAYIGTRNGVVTTPSITPIKAPDPYVPEDRYEVDRVKVPATDFRNFQHRAASYPHQVPEVSSSQIDDKINTDLPSFHATEKYRKEAIMRPSDVTMTDVNGRVVDGEPLANTFSQPVLKPASSSRVSARVVDSPNVGISSIPPRASFQAPENTGLSQLQAENARLLAQLQQSQLSAQRLSSLESTVQTLQGENQKLRQQLSSASSSASITSTPTNFMASSRDLSQTDVNALLGAEKAFRQAVQLERTGQASQAASYYSKAVQAAPQVPEYAAALGRLYIDQRELGSARQVLQRALQVNPDNTELLNELGKISLLQGQTQEASSYFSKALPSGVMSNYASSLMKMDKYADAERAYLVAIASNPSDADLYYNLGNLYLAQRQYQNALNLYQSALKYQDKLPEAHYQLGIVYSQLGQRSNAIQSLRNYLTLSPNASNRQSIEQFITQLQSGG